MGVSPRDGRLSPVSFTAVGGTKRFVCLNPHGQDGTFILFFHLNRVKDKSAAGSAFVRGAI